MTSSPSHTPTPANFLQPEDSLRVTLHNEVHARPLARVRLPALIVYVAVLNAGMTREQECELLRRLPGQQELPLDNLNSNFLLMRFTMQQQRRSSAAEILCS